jgi:hypothetical protein
MSELTTVWLRRLLLTFPHTATLDVCRSGTAALDHIDPNREESYLHAVSSRGISGPRAGDAHRWPIVHIPATIPLICDTRGVALAGRLAALWQPLEETPRDFPRGPTGSLHGL